ncbi:MAG: EAL domain-containing protein, partial [Acidothermaceae bacterium]
MVAETRPMPPASLRAGESAADGAAGSLLNRAADFAAVEACANALPDVLVDPSQPRLVFQPIVDLNKGAVAGYEALARFDGPLQATPDKWFAAAATVGLGPALESRVVRAALAARENLPVNCFLTVNVSPRALTTGPVMDEFLRGGELAGLFVELTEEQAITDPEAMRRDLARLRDRGALIALDDAGSGYSGLQRLLALRPELMKLDRSLIDGIDKDEAKRACVEMLIVLASRLDSWLLAEGIEQPAELRELINLGVPLAQGYLLGKPGPPWPG